MSGRYHSVDSCKNTLGIDRLLQSYSEQRQLVTDLILSAPETLVQTLWTMRSPVAIDNNCHCQMGRGGSRDPHSCSQCINLRRIVDLRTHAANRDFTIGCGAVAGKTFLITAQAVTAPHLTWDLNAAIRARTLTSKYTRLLQCGTPPVADLRCASGDDFTIRILLHWTLQRLLSEKGLPHLPLLYTAFLCHGEGYCLYEKPTLGNLEQLFAAHPATPEIVRGIILQLLVVLLELTGANFSHGAPSISALSFTSEPVSYRYDDVIVAAPFTLQLTQLENASATLNGVHYFPENVGTKLNLERLPFAPEITVKTVTMASCAHVAAEPLVCPVADRSSACPDQKLVAACKPQNALVYRLTNTTRDIYTALRHIGFPLYAGSFDFYALMISLMLNPQFRGVVENDPLLQRMWGMMWLAEDLESLEARLKEIKNGAVLDNIMDLMRGSWLRCDILTFVWSLIKSGV